MVNWQEEDLKYIWHPCSQMKDYETLPPIVIDHASGINLYDIDGNCYKDVVSSWWCNLLGHCNPRINEAMKKQLDKLEHVIFANFTHKTAITLCQRLMNVIPKGLCKFNFAFLKRSNSAALSEAKYRPALRILSPSRSTTTKVTLMRFTISPAFG